MKIAIPEGLLKTSHASSNFHVALPFTDDITAENLHKHGYDDWLRVPLDVPLKLRHFPKINMSSGEAELKKQEKLRSEYEAFIQGYLCYYEENVISEMERMTKDYTIYFAWNGKTKASKTEAGVDHELIIYLNPLEKQNEYADYEKKFDHQKYKNVHNKLTYQTSITHYYLTPPPSMTDPTKPSGPPPPRQIMEVL